MIWVYKYNDEFIWQPGEEIEIDVESGEQVPESYTQTQPEDGLYIAKYDPDKDEWFESASQEYIDNFQPHPITQPSKTEVIEQQIADLYYLIALGGM
ncbi:hypothetical protein [Bacillus sp. LLTC93]|uniref:hypothetical protein n=1 Tax=Bacillus sp. LLTC93 TaxID=2108274 RepID=UPI000D0148CC|nr:hypothetical protein [Bacillus sp. LLTC93]PRO41413.1 hypothetical protein C6W18_05215 [Bacillus sp. LLTC93]